MDELLKLGNTAIFGIQRWR